eukprot:6875608-Alexandrium_andersonii.AAC.1
MPLEPLREVTHTPWRMQSSAASLQTILGNSERCKRALQRVANEFQQPTGCAKNTGRGMFCVREEALQDGLIK